MNMPAPIDIPAVYSKTWHSKPRFRLHEASMMWVECETQFPLMILTEKTPWPVLACLFDSERHLNG